MIKKFSLLFYILIFIIVSVFISACHKDIINDDPEIQLSFSLDTLRFDTVFTELGSTTKYFKIYNNLEQAVILDEVMLDNNSRFFRLNVNGESNSTVADVRIEANDSIYVFAEVTIDPDQPLSVSPFIIEDEISIKANNSNYTIHLEAWGQNANYIPDRFSKSKVNLISCDLGEWHWDDPRPYVIYGALLIDSCKVIIPEGQSIYVHGGIAINELGVYNDGLIAFLPNGSLVTNGTSELPVSFQTDRLEDEFSQVSGQWTGILLTAGSKNNVLKHTSIKNSIVGISVDSSGILRMESCEIAYTSGNGLVASHASVYAQNCLFYQNLANGISLNFGGAYLFNYCTVVNLDNQLSAVSLNNLKCSDALCEGPIYVNPLFAEFNNCIVVGNEEDEISLLDATDGTDPSAFNYTWNNCIISVRELIEPDAFPNFYDHCSKCINVDRLDSIFIDVDEFNFHLDTMSIAIDKGKKIPALFIDFEGNDRELETPDIGCYEFQK